MRALPELKRSIRIGVLLSIASGLLAGCSGGGDAGAAIPDRKPVSQEEIKTMPPQAQQAASNAQRAGDFQAQQMAAMAEAQRKAQAGR